MACGSWRFAVPPFAIAPIEKKPEAAATVGFISYGLCTLQPHK